MDGGVVEASLVYVVWEVYEAEMFQAKTRDLPSRLGYIVL